MDRRNVLKIAIGAALAAGAAETVLNTGSSEKKAEKPKEEKPKEIVKEKLSPEYEAHIQKILDRAINKWDTIGRVLWNTQNGALAKNYRQFAILNTYGSRFTDKGLDIDQSIIAARDTLLKDENYKRAFLRDLKANGYFKPLSKQQEQNLARTDDAYDRFRYGMWLILQGSDHNKLSTRKPEDLSLSEIESYAPRLTLNVRYFDDRNNGISFSLAPSWQ